MAIPTLTDIANRMVQGIGTATGMIRNPFTEQIRALEERLQTSKDSDEIVKLNDQLRTLRAASDEWSSYDVAKQDPTAAPEWTPEMFNKADTDVRFLEGLAGLKYAPLPKGAVRNKLADVYSAQTEPLNNFGTAGYRAAYNALLDTAREGGLAGLYGLGYLDGEEE